MLKIALMSRWNAACGTSLYGELIGRELMKRGYDLFILAPSNDDKLTLESDEEEVKRCYSIYRFGWTEVEKELDPGPFLNLDYNLFIAQGFRFITSMDQFREIYPKIKEKAKTIYVVHERTLSSSPFAEFDWDMLVCFDERYKKVVSEAIGEEKCRIIPYPYYPVVKGEMKEARGKLNLPQDKRIILSFGWRIEDYIPLLPIIEEVNEEFPLTYLVVADPRVAPKLDEMAEKSFVELRHEVPSTERLYTYLHASDCLLLHRKDVGKREVVLSSVVHMCLGSLTPIVTTATRYVEMLENEVIKYSILYELKDKLIRIFENSDFVKRTIEEAERHVKENSAERIVDEYVRLFDSLLAK
ncbi:MAG TPA: hypothetical protein DCP08_03150 [Chloroflexi bacterium]|nr:hypothetical protein [Chloroflexota bacterium]